MDGFAIQMLIYGSLSLSIVLALYQRWSRYLFGLLLMLAGMGYMAVMGASSRGAQIALLALGLLVAIPAILVYNGLLRKVDVLAARWNKERQA